MRLNANKREAILGSYFSTEEMLKSLTEDLTFERFLDLKKTWLKNLKTEWLVMGHLTQQEALELVYESEKGMSFTPLDENHLPICRLVKLPSRSVHEMEEINEDPSNPNSAAMAMFQCPELKNFETEAAFKVLFHLLKEPFFN